MHDWNPKALLDLLRIIQESQLAAPKLQAFLERKEPILSAMERVFEADYEDVSAGNEDTALLLTSPKLAFWLGSTLMDGGDKNFGEFPLPKGTLAAIGRSAKYSYLWSHEYHSTDGRRWKQGCNAYLSICQSGEFAARYAVEILDTTFPDGEAAIIADPVPQWAEWYDYRLSANLIPEWNRMHPDQPPINRAEDHLFVEPDETEY